ncbi:hypothetical protein HanIR_Chr14g0725781 [Helianthus annuus]|nr:hypothetical protein HanIR_Chr14g0725781 [Helianthus annuus]
MLVCLYTCLNQKETFVEPICNMGVVMVMVGYLVDDGGVVVVVPRRERKRGRFNLRILG